MSAASIPRPKRVVSGRAVALCAVATGALLWLATDVRWLSGLAWVALAPLSLLARVPAPPRKLYAAAYLGGLAFFVPGVWWLGTAAPEWWQAGLMRGLLAGYLAAYFPLYLLLARLLLRQRLPLLFAAPIAWVACEFLRMHVMTGFGWLMLAHALHRWTWTIQIADLGGVYAVSYLAATASAMLVELLTQPLMLMHAGKPRFDPTGTLAWRLWTTAFLLAGSQLYGVHRVREGESAFTPGANVALLHTDLPQTVKNDDPEAADARVQARAFDQDMAGIELMVWPETALVNGYYGLVDPAVADAEVVRLFRERIRVEDGDWQAVHVRNVLGRGLAGAVEIAERYRTPFLVCAIRNEIRPGRMVRSNASVLLAPGRGEVAWYGKVHLVPFGEYLPLRDAAPFLSALMPYAKEQMKSFGWDAAAEPTSIHYGKLHCGPLICFEDTIPDLARAHARVETPDRPLDFLVNHSNDGWFAGTSEPARHLAAALFRCVECRAPMIRSTNLGATCVIDGNGKVVAAVADLSQPTTLVARVPLDPRRSLYSRWGDVLAWACLAACGAAMLAALAEAARRVRRRLAGR